MDPVSMIQSLGGGLAATVIVVQSIVIVALFRLLMKSRDREVELMQIFSKESRELHVASNNAAHVMERAIETNTEALRQAIATWRQK